MASAVVLRVEGMVCRSCTSAVGAALRAVDGVSAGAFLRPVRTYKHAGGGD